MEGLLLTLDVAINYVTDADMIICDSEYQSYIRIAYIKINDRLSKLLYSNLQVSFSLLSASLMLALLLDAWYH